MRRNIYASGRIDRAAHLRADQAWVSAQLGDSRCRLVPVWRSRHLVEEREAVEPRFLPPEPSILSEAPAPVFLGLVEGVPHFALDLSARDEAAAQSLGRFEDLRSVGPLMAHDDGALLAYARGMLHWHQGHRFCGRCGHETEPRDAGHVRVCRGTECGASVFPRTDPAVIMLVHNDDHVLLGRQAAWPKGMHSVLAGFVEPGESLEDAVSREISEEVGIGVAEIEYHSSQPWPFPASIMLGFSARAKTTDLSVNRDELEAARWYHREELLASPENQDFRLPRRDSISYRLIADWLGQGE